MTNSLLYPTRLLVFQGRSYMVVLLGVAPRRRANQARILLLNYRTIENSRIPVGVFGLAYTSRREEVTDTTFFMVAAVSVTLRRPDFPTSYYGQRFYRPP